MFQQQILDKTIQIVFSLLENNNLVIDKNSSSENIAEWNSLKHIQIINEVEVQFGISFDIDDILDLTTVHDIANKIFELKNANH